MDDLPAESDNASEAGGGLFQTEDLDREKFALEKQKFRDAKLLAQLEQKLELVRNSLLDKRARMSQYDSTFLVTGSVQKLDEDKLRQTLNPETKFSKRPLYEKSLSRFGRHEAVMGTKKVISKHLTQIQKLTGVMGKKLNTAEHRNDQMRSKIDGLRKEHLVYDRLFDRLQSEIALAKAGIESAKDKVKGRYAARDQVRLSIQSSMHALEEAQIVAKTEWAVMDTGLEEMELQAQGTSDAYAEGAVGGNLTQEQEQNLKEQQHAALSSINADQQKIDKLQIVYEHYRDAIVNIQNDTGYDNIEQLITQMNQFEDEKFGTVAAINRIMVEIEEREATVQRMTADFESKEDSNLALTQTQRHSLDAVQRQAQSVLGDVKEKKAEIKSLLRELALVLKPVQRLFSEVGALEVFGGAKPSMTAFPVTENAKGTRQLSTADVASSAEVGDAEGSEGGAAEGKSDESKHSEVGGQNGREDTIEPSEGLRSSTPERKDGGSDAGANLHLEVGFDLEAMDGAASPTPSALRMYMLSPALRETFVSGISVNSLAEFTTMMEQAAAEILQKYAVVMAAPKESSAGQAALAALRRNGHGSSTSNPAAAALGPQHGTQNSRSGLTSSALMAAMVDPEAMTIPEDDDDDVQPYTISDLKEQATAQLRSQQFTSAKAASKQAAKYLVQTHNRRGH